MTKTTAKKGMVEHKTGHSKDNFDYAFIKDIPYGGSEKTVDEIIKGFIEEVLVCVACRYVSSEV